MSDTVRIGLLGAGRVGAMHADLIDSRVPGAEVTLVYDASPERAARIGVPVAPDAAALVSSRDVDAVAVCSSTDTHIDLVVAAAEAGKPVFCEKPLSLELAEVDRALDAVERTRTVLQVGFNRRFDPGHRSVRDAVVAGEIGDVHLVRITSRDPEPPPLDYVRRSGGLFLDMTIHDFDMARFVAGRDVVEVFARGEVRVDAAIGDAGDVDTAVVVLVHEDGVLTTIDNSRRAVYGYDQRVEAFGSGGMASSGNETTHEGVILTAAGSLGAPLRVFFLERYLASYVAEWEAFLVAVRGEAPPPVTGEDARAALAIGVAASRSAREGRPVRVGAEAPRDAG